MDVIYTARQLTPTETYAVPRFLLRVSSSPHPGSHAAETQSVIQSIIGSRSLASTGSWPVYRAPLSVWLDAGAAVATTIAMSVYVGCGGARSSPAAAAASASEDRSLLCAAACASPCTVERRTKTQLSLPPSHDVSTQGNELILRRSVAPPEVEVCEQLLLPDTRGSAAYNNLEYAAVAHPARGCFCRLVRSDRRYRVGRLCEDQQQASVRPHPQLAQRTPSRAHCRLRNFFFVVGATRLGIGTRTLTRIRWITRYKLRRTTVVVSEEGTTSRTNMGSTLQTLAKWSTTTTSKFAPKLPVCRSVLSTVYMSVLSCQAAIYIGRPT